MKFIPSAELTFTSAMSVIGGFIANAMGGWSSDLVTLVIFMSIDFLMGIIIAGFLKKSGHSDGGGLSSAAGFKGLLRKCIMLAFVLIANRLDIVIGTDYIRTAVIIGFAVNELVSIVENAGIMGVPLPSVITKAIDLLKNKTTDDKS